MKFPFQRVFRTAAVFDVVALSKILQENHRLGEKGKQSYKKSMHTLCMIGLNTHGPKHSNDPKYLLCIDKVQQHLPSCTPFYQAHLQLQLQLQLEDDIALFLFYPPPTHSSGQVVTLTQTELG